MSKKDNGFTEPSHTEVRAYILEQCTILRDIACVSGTKVFNEEEKKMAHRASIVYGVIEFQLRMSAAYCYSMLIGWCPTGPLREIWAEYRMPGRVLPIQKWNEAQDVPAGHRKLLPSVETWLAFHRDHDSLVI